MKSFPHHYQVTASSTTNSDVNLRSGELPALSSAPPLEFDGPGDQWSPETLLVAAVADCFILTFKVIAGASHFDWQSIDCEVEGTLDREQKIIRFSEFSIRVRLLIAADASDSQAVKLLEKTEHSCLVSNSLSAEVKLEIDVITP